MGVQTVDYKGNLAPANTALRNMSPNVWADCPWGALVDGTVPGRCFMGTFDHMPLVGVQTTQIGWGPYKVFGTVLPATPVFAINSVLKPGGALAFPVGAANEVSALAQAYPSYLMTGLTSNSGKLWFEADVAASSILTATGGFFVGLAETDKWTFAAAVPFNGDTAVINASAAAIGFLKGEDALGQIDTVRSDRAAAWTTIGSNVGSLSAAYAFTRVGMTYDPADSAKCVRFFVNGLEHGTGLTRTALQAFTNLDANALGLCFSQILDTGGAAVSSYLGWWRVAQVWA